MPDGYNLTDKKILSTDKLPKMSNNKGCMMKC